jgi:hypothetical protein
MTRSILVGASLFIMATAPALAGEREDAYLRRNVAAQKTVADDCETRIQKLDASQAEGEERLAEKYAVIDLCSRQYRRDKTIEALVKECTKYVEQAVVKQQFVAECALAAYGYANALRALKAGYRK